MAIRVVVTRGFGNGTFNGTIADVARRGYTSAAVVVPTTPGFEYTAPTRRGHYTTPTRRFHYTAPKR